MRRGNDVSPSIVEFEDEIARTHAQLDVCLFWPEQFAQLAPLDDAERMLMTLVSVGKLRCRAELRCCHGHTVWEHDLDRLDEGRARKCETCAEPAEDAYLRFEIADSWLASLKKKAARSARPARRRR
jgi:hypothetical protein